MKNELNESGKTKASKAVGKKVAGSRKPSQVGKKTVARRKLAKKKAGVRKASASSKKRHQLIQRAAYFLAEKRGFSGNPLHHWIQAEKLIDE